MTLIKGSLKILFTVLLILGPLSSFSQGLDGEKFREFDELIDSARTYRYKPDFKPGLQLLNEAEKLLDPEHDRFWFGKLESQRANLYFGKGDMDPAGTHFLKAEYHLDPFKDSIEYVMNKYNLGSYYTMSYQYNSGLQKFLTTIKLIRRQMSKNLYDEDEQDLAERLLAACWQSLGTISLFVHEEEKAIEYYTSSLDQFQQLDDEVSVSHTYINIGEAYTRLEKPDKAKAFLERGHEITLKLNREVDLGLNYQLYGTIAHLNGEWEEAMKFYNLSDQYYEKYTKYQDQHLLRLLQAETLLKLNKADSAITLLEEAVDYLDRNSIYKFRAQAYNQLGDAYQFIGNYERSMKAFNSGRELQDSVIYQAEKNMASEMISFIDDERAEYLDSLTILKQSVVSKEQELELNEKTFSNRLLIFSIIFLAIVLAAVLYFLRRNRYMNKRLNQSLDENKILFQEVHHRVKNNFQIISSLLNLQMGHEGNTEEKMNQLRSRIMSMSLVHELLYRTDEADSVSFKSYAQELIKSVLVGSSIAESEIKFEVESGNEAFKLDTSIPLGLIMNEALTNSIKYAFPNGLDGAEIKVVLNNEGEFYLLEIMDNGIGIQEDSKSEESLGHELIEILSEQLEGRFDYVVQDGTNIRVWFKG